MGIVDSILKALGMGGKEPPAAVRDAERRAAEMAAEAQRKASELAAETQRKAGEAAAEVRRQAEAAAAEVRERAGEAADAASRKLQEAADALEARAGQAGGVAAEMARHAAGAARTAATNIEAAADAIEDRLEAAAETLEDRVEAIAETAEARIREIAAPAIAAVGGMMAGETQAAQGAAETAGAQGAGETHLEGRKCMSKVSMTVNGRRVEREVEDRTLLVQFLREDLNLTGTHVGCDTSQCGACAVHVDGVAVKSCTMLAAQASGASVVTIEGLAKDGALHPVQEAFREHHGLQCGFCTPGMIMTAVDMIERAKKNGVTLDEATIRHELEGNICRCTGYHNIVRAIESAAAAA